MKNPVERFNQTLKRAERKGHPLANAVALATSSKSGKPSVRMMLLKGADSRGFRLFTNIGSRKGKELRQNANAALCFWWPELEEQVRVEGRLQKLKAREIDAYFASRPRGSQIGAWASKQSSVLKSRKDLLSAAQIYEKKFKGKKVPRPPFWLGFILIPKKIEFWRNEDNRLHHRELYTRQNGRWKQNLLYP